MTDEEIKKRHNRCSVCGQSKSDVRIEQWARCWHCDFPICVTCWRKQGNCGADEIPVIRRLFALDPALRDDFDAVRKHPIDVLRKMENDLEFGDLPRALHKASTKFE